MSEIRSGSYRFDTGPSLFTMPDLIEELLEIDGHKDVVFEYKRLSTLCHYFWKDGATFVAPADRTLFIARAVECFKESSTKLKQFMDANKLKYELTKSIFLESPIKNISTWFSHDALKAYKNIPSLDIFSKMHEVHQRYLTHPQLIQLFDRYASYNGSNPYNCSGIMTMISHLEYDLGAYFPLRGMYSIIEALADKAKNLGVELRLNNAVDKILVDQNNVYGVHDIDVNHPADAVLSNVDNYFTYKHLLNDQSNADRIDKQERSTSAIIFYWAINQSFTQLDLHNIFFSKNYRAEFDSLEEGSVFDDPTIYVNISSKHRPEDAPAGCENWFVMINVSAKHYEDEKALAGSYRQIVKNKLSAILNVNIENCIVSESVLTPGKLEHQTGAYKGALYGLSSNDRMAAFFRENNKSKHYKGLFFCGGTGHPGGGIPLCLQSAKISTKMIDEYLRR